jgi:hypothetical protein
MLARIDRLGAFTRDRVIATDQYAKLGFKHKTVGLSDTETTSKARKARAFFHIRHPERAAKPEMLCAAPLIPLADP